MKKTKSKKVRIVKGDYNYIPSLGGKAVRDKNDDDYFKRLRQKRTDKDKALKDAENGVDSEA